MSRKHINIQPPKRTCKQKIRFVRKHDAELAADEMMIMQPDLQLGVYKCLSCGGWHLTRRKFDIN